VLTALTCPRCLRTPLRPKSNFCPRCGLGDVLRAAAGTGPIDVPAAGRVFRILERVATGSISNVHRCRFFDGPHELEAIAKIVRDGRSNDLLANEAATLGRLHAADPGNRYTPFLPYAEATFPVPADPARSMRPGTPAGPPRQATVFRVHPAIRSPADELYTLDEVRAAYSGALDPRQAAWIWRRVLTVLGFAHSHGVIHGAVLPPHLLVEPREHKLLLVDWCSAIPIGGGRALRMVAGARFTPWYKREHASRNPPMPALDIALGARSMIELMGGDPLAGTVPPTVDPALHRYFGRCMGFSPSARPDAWRLLADFDGLIETLWGPRQFVPLPMPPKLRV
jgi:hypothetical protein